MDAQRRTALIFVTEGVGCASCMCDWGIKQAESNILKVSGQKELLIIGFVEQYVSQDL